MKTCKLIEIPTLCDARGKLSFIEFEKYFDFAIKRVYWLYNLSQSYERGFHAHKNIQQVMFALQGSCDVVLDNAVVREKVCLDNPNKGIIIGTNIWRELKNFNNDTIIMNLASDFYNEDDYIRNYDDFLNYASSFS